MCTYHTAAFPGVVNKPLQTTDRGKVHLKVLKSSTFEFCQVQVQVFEVEISKYLSKVQVLLKST